MKKFRLGHFVMTNEIAIQVYNTPAFANFVTDSFKRYINGDWGDTCEEDAKANEIAASNGERILAVYHIPENLEMLRPVADTKIWFITEADRSATTVLFPSEY